MKKLTEYQKNGHDFTLIERSGEVAIFHGKSRINDSETWEVILIQSHQGRVIMGNYYEPTEYPPNNTQWGSFGWTCASLDRAKEMMEELKP